jgi:hypothetical protein
VRRAGITLLELLVAAFIVAVMIGATTRAFLVGYNTSQSIVNQRTARESRVMFEDQVATLIRRAWLTASVTETGSFFVGQVGPMTPGDTTTPGSTSGSSSGMSSTSSSGSSASSDNPLSNSGNSDNLTFTSVGSRVPEQFIESTDDWETNNQNFGPQGGVAEICLTTTPEDDPANHTGLFVRTQRPADNDPTQGGYEQVLNPDVSAIGFEFYDGANWDPVWDTRTMTQRRLPAAVRVTYRFTKDTEDHVFVVNVPYSDVTAANPITQ